MIRLPDIPSLGQTAIGNPGISAAALAAPAVALGHVAAKIGQVSDQFHDQAIRIQKMENARIESERRAQLATDYAQLQVDLQTDQDPASRLTKTDAFLQQAKGLMDDGNLPPAVRDSLVSHFDGFATNARIHQARDSSRLAIKRSFDAAQNEIDVALSTGDETSALGAVNRLQQSGIITPEEAAAKHLEIQTKAKDFHQEQDFKEDLSLIDSDPFAAKPLLESPEPPPGEDPTLYARKREHLRLTLGREQNRILDDIRDRMATGSLNTPDQLDPYTEKLGPATVATLKDGMLKSLDENRKRQISTPESQAAIIGSVSSAIDSLDPKDIESRVRIESQLDDIQPGPTKNHLSGELTKKLSGEPPSPGPMRRVRSMLNEAYQRGYFGQVATTPEQTTADVVADDFLIDGQKLQKIGLAEDKVKIITDPTLSNEKRLAKFRELYPSRDTKNVTADEYTQRAARALIERRQSVPKTEEEKSREMRDSIKAIQRKGEIEKGLLEWQQDHPDGDIEAELMRRLGDAESSTFLDSLEGGSWFAPDDTGTTTNPDMPGGLGMASDSLLPPK